MSPSPRTRLAMAAGRLVATASRLAGRGRGQQVGGRVMLRLAPGLLRDLAWPMAATLVSATNGKSTTTRFIAEALRTSGPTAHNATGANMGPGVATALAAHPGARYAALEVDEAHLPYVARQTRAGVLVLMNLSRDQLDRGAEVTLLAQRWHGLLEGADWPVTVVANADDPLVAWAAGPAGRIVWAAGGQWWREDSALCPVCAHPLARGVAASSLGEVSDGVAGPGGTVAAGSGGAPDDGANPGGRGSAVGGAPWWCPECGFARPRPDWWSEAGRLRSAGGADQPIRLALPGRVNIGNAVMAAAAVAQSGIAPEAALAAFAQVGDVDGRYVEAAGPGGRTVRLLLGKNPASWTELIDMVAGPADAEGSAGPRGLVIAINARGADGRDPSWLWDVPFERLAGRPVWAAGERRYDLAVRLDVAGLDVRGVVADPLAAAGRADGAGPVDIVANYTAFQNVRARLGLGVKVA